NDKPHLAVAAHMRGEDEILTLLKCLGNLAAAGVKIDLDFLYGYPENHFFPKRAPSANAIRVQVGGAPILLPPLPVKAKPSEVIEEIVRPDQLITPPPAYESQPTQAVKIPPEIERLQTMMTELSANAAATAQAHEQFLQLSNEMTRQFGATFHLQNQLLGMLAGEEIDLRSPSFPNDRNSSAGHFGEPIAPVAFTRAQCLQFAVGSAGKVLGHQFDIIDTYKVRVRLPDEPLMLVDRILIVEGEKCSLGPGRIITEHDVLPGAWYLDGDRAPVCISVEAGQADLFLSSYLGIDHQVQGDRSYRLLDAKIQFHRGLPRPGETIRYDIHIDKFVRQGATFLFFFRFEGYIGDQHLITMTDGCAGFFTQSEVQNSGGIILTEEDRAANLRLRGTPYSSLLPLEKVSYDEAQLDALRAGDASRCFGLLFEKVELPPALRLPSGRMRLIDRVVSLEPNGGRWGLGCITAEADIHPDDWFLTCHFVDDKVMPGTLMYECCAHTLRVLLLRLGWITKKTDVCYEPVQGVPCRLKCRGPVTPSTRHVHYTVEVKEIGYRPEPYVLADAHMYADGDYIVFFKDMSMQMSGVTGEEIVSFWRQRTSSAARTAAGKEEIFTTDSPKTKAIFSKEHILEFAVGSPSKAYGEPYRIFDRERKIARLPGPPYCFMDRVVAIEPPPWVLKADGWVQAEYDLPADEWYFAADRSGVMPFCVLLEIALQPCGWLAAYVGSALKSNKDLKFRNLGGNATQHANILPKGQTLTMRSRITKVSEAADMIIEHFDFEVLSADGLIYTGNTYFGFFTHQALAQQVGLREAHYTPTADDLRHNQQQVFKDDAPFTPQAALKGQIHHPTGLQMPAKALRMIDGVDLYNPQGGPHGLGYVRGSKIVNPDEWFFKAHFYQDPVCPGSLGVESFLQLIKFAALQQWPQLTAARRFEMVTNAAHGWQYRGQVIPTNQKVQVDAVITRIQDGPEPVIMADGWLHVDGLTIYSMKNFGLKLANLNLRQIE
ncbi:MAG: hypothetical protein M0036_06870, partial [Desulfobacteraceae bacterium]|nr:hypothetical protein [Desulfobacteraceae bacterium]